MQFIKEVDLKFDYLDIIHVITITTIIKRIKAGSLLLDHFSQAVAHISLSELQTNFGEMPMVDRSHRRNP